MKLIKSAFYFVICILNCYALQNNENIENANSTCVERDEVTFQLWTRELQKSIPLIYGQLKDIPVLRDKPFKFIIHGYTDHGDREWLHHMKDSYLQKGSYNVVLVDWKRPAGSIWYPTSAKNARQAGAFVGDIILDLNQTHGVPFESIHLLGHSLGSHMSGFAGKEVKSRTGISLGRITGMDPAGPYFWLAEPSNRLSKDDALFVDVIHTDDNKLGHPKSLGHVDFYPNGGKAPQPGCFFFESYGIGTTVICSHIRVLLLFKESINSNGFISHQCSSYQEYINGTCKDNPSVVMGDNTPTEIRGKFYLKTNSNSPYARNGEI